MSRKPPHISNMSMMLDSKLFSACFAPAMPGCAVPLDDPRLNRTGKDSRRGRSRSKDTKGKNRVRAASAYHRRHDSFLTKDEQSDLLVAEVDLSSSDGSSGTDTDDSGSSESDSSSSYADTERDLNTIGDGTTSLMMKMRKTLGENKNITNGQFLTTSLQNQQQQRPHPISPSSSAQAKYDKSIRRRFQYMRLQHQFSAGGQDPPSDRSMDSGKSQKADGPMGSYGMTQRRNELAKQILRRRKDVVALSRTGFDPPIAR